MAKTMAETAVLRRRVTTAEGRQSEKNDGSDLGAATATAADAAPPTRLELRPRFSSGVAFYPPSDTYWRIGGKWYDFADFLHLHPGGSDVLRIARDRFEDATFVFESHHPNYRRARAIIRKYEVDVSIVRASGLGRGLRVFDDDGLSHRPETKTTTTTSTSTSTPRLLDDAAFYSVMRRRVTEHLRVVGSPRGGPTSQCVALFWTSFVSWSFCYLWLLCSGSTIAAVCLGFTAAWLGAFGHNWVHQPGYRLWARLSLDTIGFSSDAWFREHNLQHHMYTNTPWDNHFEGSAPWLVTDPTIERNALQRFITPYINPLLLSFGLYTNYLVNLIEACKGNDVITPWKLFLPLEIAAMAYAWGWRGLLLMYISHAILGVYYFTIALMNHNAEHCHDVAKRNASRDWGEAQLACSADWAVGMPFWAAGAFLWLNYHTVHHLFPLTDMSHHPAMQRILIETCEEFGIDYVVLSPTKIYMQMIRSFSSPRSLFQEIMVYGGGI